MPIQFSVNQHEGYFRSRYTGKISEEDVTNAYERFFQKVKWVPGYNELTDLSEADLTEVTVEGIRRFAHHNLGIYKKYNITSVKTAVYAPRDLQFGLARMYSQLADQFPDNIRVFRDIKSAEEWLKET